jgi:hypothetical protein
MFSSKLRVAVIALLILGGRCHAAGHDAVSAQNNSQDQSIVSDVQAKLFSDSVLKTLDIRVFCKDGAVTLAGTVETDLERAAVERIARQEPGVTDVLNNLAVVKSPDAAADTTNAAPVADSAASPNNAAPDSNDSNADANNSTPGVSTAAPALAFTLPSGTPLTVRMIDDVDSATTKVGDAFHASLENALVVGEVIVAPNGADVYGKLVRVKPNGKIAGAGKLTLELTGIQVRGQLVAIDSETYEVVGKGRGKQSAGTIGGGAAAGAAIGGIAGGGPGAAIGAAAGAGGGTLIQLLRHRDQLRVPSETLLEFKLQQAVDIPAVPPAPAAPTAAETPATPAEPAVSTEPIPAEDTLQAGDGLIFVPILTGDSKTLAPGFSAHGNFSKGDDRIVLDAGATADFGFNVPNGRTLTVVFGTPIGGFVNTVSTEVSVNGQAIATISGVPNGIGVKSPVRQFLWRKSFGPGSYVLSFRSGGWGINFYGLWLSNPALAGSPQSAPTTSGSQPPTEIEHLPSLVFVPVLASDNRTLAPGFSTHGAVDIGSELVSIHASASISYSFKVAAGQSVTIAYGTPTGGYLSSALVELALNGVTIGSIDKDPNYVWGQRATLRRLLWHKTFGPGAYVLTFRSGGEWVNFYGLWLSSPSSASSAPQDPPAGPPTLAAIEERPAVVRAIVEPGRSAIQLPHGDIYLYGFATGAGLPSGPFAFGQFAQATAVSGNLAAALAYGATDHNQYRTSTYSHAIAGVSVSGRWKTFRALSGSNSQPSVTNASVSFTTTEDSLVVFIGLGGAQEVIELNGVPGMQVDGSCSLEQQVPGIVVAHANLAPGTYTVTGYSSEPKPFSDYVLPKADLVGVFIFGGYSASQAVTPTSTGAPEASTDGIRSIDFRNFVYHPACSSERDVQIRDGMWKGGTDDSPENFGVVSVTYGDLIRDGREEAVVLGACGGAFNFDIADVLVYAKGTDAPRLLAELSPKEWGKGEVDNGGDFAVSEIHITNHELAISFYAGGFHAQPDWVVTAKFRWNGSGFERVGIDRKPFTGWLKRS